MTLATPDDVSISLGRPLTDATELLQVQQWLNDAELLIRMRLGPIESLDQDAVLYVEREAVVARLRNPDGLQSETIDDYTFRYAAESRRVVILDEWWALLDPNASQASASIRPSFEPDLVQWPVRTPPFHDLHDWWLR